MDGAGRSIVSLGVDCRVRYQVSRFLDARAMGPPDVEHGAAAAEMHTGAHLFDWNVTWFGDVVRVFEYRFEDLFVERELRPLAELPSVAVDGRYGFRYFHLFHHGAELGFAQMVATQYAIAAEKVFYLRDKLLARLSAASPTLYIRAEGGEEDAREFCAVVRRLYPAHRFHLVLVEPQAITDGFVRREEFYSVYRMAARVRKPAEHAWSGDDLEWTTLLAQI